MSTPLLKNPLKPLETILFSEIVIVFFMAFGFLPQEFSYLILLLLGVSFIRLNTLDSLKLFILSIPFFVALPANALSDSMSVWRVLIAVLFLKVVYEKYKFYLGKTLIGCHCEKGRRSNPEENALNHKLKLGEAKIGITTALMSLAMTKIKNLATLRFLKQIIKRMGRVGGYKQKILKRVQDDKINKLFLLVSLFFIIAALSLLFAQNIGVGIKKILFLANIFLLFPVVIFTIKKERDLIEILKVIFYSSGAIVLIGYFQFLSTFFVPLYNFWQFWAGNIIKAFYGEGLSNLLAYSNTWFSYYKVFPPTLRMFSVMPDSHSFAMLVIISTPVILSLIFYYQGKHKEKKYLSVALILFFMAVFFSGSRGAWMGSIFALIAALYLAYGLREPIITINFPKWNLNIIFYAVSTAVKSGFRLCQSLLPILNRYILKPLSRQGRKKYVRPNLFISNKIENIKFCFSGIAAEKNKINSKLIIYSIILFFVLMPVSFSVLRQNQEIQLFQQGISFSNKEKSIIFERAISIYDFSETSNKGRLQIWKETVISITAHPLLGVGFGNFPLVLEEKLTASKRGSSAHSVYLDIAAEIGIFGLAVFLFILAEILKVSYNLFHRLKKEYLKMLAGSFFVYFIWVFGYGIFDVVIFNDKVLIFVVILIGVLYAIEEVNKESVEGLVK